MMNSNGSLVLFLDIYYRSQINLAKIVNALRYKMVSASVVFKINAAFLGVFALQFLLVPHILMEQNFQAGSYTLDRFHYFFMRGFGVLALGFIGLSVQVDADKFLPFMTAFHFAFCTALPWYAQAFLPTTPMHYVATGGTIVIAALFLMALSDAGKTKGN